MCSIRTVHINEKLVHRLKNMKRMFVRVIAANVKIFKLTILKIRLSKEININ